MKPPLPRVLGLLCAAFVLHEAEEWDLVAWLETHFEPGPGFDDREARTLLVAIAALAAAWTAAALWLLPLRGALFALLPLYVGVALGNALTHIVWLFSFGAYAPGVATSALLLVPLSAYLVVRVWRERLVPRAFVGALLVIALVQPIGAAAAGGTLSAPQIALQRLGARLGQWLWGA